MKQAEARYRQANALLEQQKASRSVSLSLEGAAKRNGAKHTSPNSQFSTGVQASWIPDVWGRVAKAIEGQQENLEAVQADLAAVKLNQQLLATEAYWSIRVLDAQLDVLQQTQKKLPTFGANFKKPIYSRDDCAGRCDTGRNTVETSANTADRNAA